MMITQTVPNSVTIVKYEPSARQWQAVNGRTWAWPAGPEGRRQAELYALEHDRPDVAEEVKAVIANAENLRLEMFDTEGISKRAIKAGFLIRDGKLLPPVAFGESGSYLNEIARVQGSELEPYAVCYIDDEVVCNCPDFLLGNAPTLPSGQAACKHILAVLISEALELDEEALLDLA